MFTHILIYFHTIEWIDIGPVCTTIKQKKNNKHFTCCCSELRWSLDKASKVNRRQFERHMRRYVKDFRRHKNKQKRMFSLLFGISFVIYYNQNLKAFDRKHYIICINIDSHVYEILYLLLFKIIHQYVYKNNIWKWLCFVFILF